MPFVENNCKDEFSVYAKTATEVASIADRVVGRGERIRTSDSCVPNAVLYQAELHPEFPIPDRNDHCVGFVFDS